MLNKHDKKEKYFLSLLKDLEKIEKEYNKLPLVELKEPYQKGWKIYYDFKDEIKSREDINILYEALKLGYYKHKIIYKVNEIKAIRKGLGYYKYKSHTTVLSPDYKRHSKENFNNFNEKIKKYFSDWRDSNDKIYYKINLPSHYLVLKNKANMITHMKNINGDIESKIKEIQKELEIYWREYGFSYSKSFPAYKDRSIIKTKIKAFLKGQIEEIENEKIPLEYKY